MKPVDAWIACLAMITACTVHGASVDGIPFAFCSSDSNPPQCQSHPQAVIGAGPSLARVDGVGSFHGGFLDGETLVLGASTGHDALGQSTGAIVSVDIRTGQRQVRAGSFADPARGVVDIGLPLGEVFDVQPGPMAGNGTHRLYAVGHDGLVVIDPDGAIHNPWRLHAPLGCDVAVEMYPGLSVTTLAVDDRARVYLSAGDRIFRLEADTLACSEVTSATRGAGPAIDSVRAMRWAQSALWVLDGSSLFRVDPVSGDRVRVSSPDRSSPVGGGDAFIGADALEVGDASVISASENGVVVDVDVATGERRRLGSGAGPAPWPIDGVWALPGSALIFIASGPGILVRDRLTAQSNWLSR